MPEQFSFSRWGNPDGRECHYIDFGGIAEASKTFDGYTIPTELRAGWFFGSERFDLPARVRFESEGEFFRCTIDKAIYR
ncbi:MAG: hypothetical protein LH647_18575, partial [Leptolyngbyaceae cyanobacterium CAN_BIN12]|nr:hypothetical protein [Leptolyngbyaceae cyanobacterium CAN_BIN12]